jgi:16S rRNA C967 or C1407 C5-methylase (RsmB/RsmF family)
LRVVPVEPLAAKVARGASVGKRSGVGLSLTPHSAGTDGFFVAVLASPL